MVARHALRSSRCSIICCWTHFRRIRKGFILSLAVERQIEIIGEAARGVSDAFKSAHPEIPWRPIMAQRHRLSHEYGEIDDRLIWTVATIHVPALIVQLEPLIPPKSA